MKAKDTVLSDTQLEENIRQDYKNFRVREETLYNQDLLSWTREVQAEVSFKAGIKEMVEFCEENQMPDNPESNPYPGIIIISKAYWQAKLKELEV